MDLTDTALGRDVACYERVFFFMSRFGTGPAKGDHGSCGIRATSMSSGLRWQTMFWGGIADHCVNSAYRSHPRSWWVGEAEGAEVMEAEHCVTLKMPDLQAGIYFPRRRFSDDGGCDRRDETIWPATRCITVAKFPASFPIPILNDMSDKGQKEAESRCSWRRWAVGFYVLHNRRLLIFDLGT